MRNIGQCKCGNDIKIDDLVADGDGFLAYQCPNCMKIFYSHDKPRNVAKPNACPQLYEGWRDANKEFPEIEGEYLCISKWITNDLGQIFYRIFYFDGKKWLTDNIYDQRFVAWRPLPDPPAFV